MKRKLFLLFFILLIVGQSFGQKRPIDRTLFEAIKASDHKKVAKLFSFTADAKAVDENDATTLMWAAFKSDLKMVQLLIKNGADPAQKGIIYLDDDKTAYYGNLLGIAAGEGKIDMVKYFVEKLGISADDRQIRADKSENGWSALQEAASAGHIEIVKYLISKGANINSQAIIDGSPVQGTPLILALKNQQFEIVRYLLEQKADVNKTDESDLTPLAFAIVSNNRDLVDLVINAGADIFYPVLKGSGYLMLTAFSGDVQLFRDLMSKGLDISKCGPLSYQDLYIYTPLGVASATGNMDMLKFLVESLKLEVNMTKATIQGEERFVLSPLHIAILSQQEEAARYLVEHGADVNLVELEYKNSPLGYAAYKNLPDLCKYLLDKGANINHQSSLGNTPLILAISWGYTDVSKLLMDYDADPSFSNKEGNGALYFAFLQDDVLMREYIVNADKSTISKWKYPSSMIYQAILADSFDLVKKMLSEGYRIDLPDVWGNTALVYAIQNGNKEMMEFLLNNKAIINENRGTQTPLCEAILKSSELAELLILKGADINQKSPSGDYPLFYALNNDDVTILNLLLHKNALINQANDSLDFPVHHAIINNRLLALKALVAAGADLSKKNSEGLDALQFALKNEAGQDIVEFLKNPVIDPNEMFDAGLEWSLPYYSKINPKSFEAKDSTGMTVVHKLLNNNNNDLLDIFLKNGVNINIADGKGRTPLYYAILIGNPEMAKKLISLNADVKKSSERGDNPLELALELGYSDLAKLLTAKGCKVRQNVSVTPQLYVSLGHTQGVITLDVSADGKYILSFGYDKKVILWEAATGKEIKTFEGIEYFMSVESMSYYLNSIHFSPDGNRFLISGAEIAEYSIYTGEKLRVFDGLGNSCYSKDGKYVFCGGGVGQGSKKSFAKMFNAATTEIVRVFRDESQFGGEENYPDGQIYLTGDGKYVVVGESEDIVFYSVADGSVFKKIPIYKCRSLTVSPDQKAVLYTSGRFIYATTLEDQTSIMEQAHPGSIACFSPDGQIIASGGHDQLVILWDAKTGNKLKEMFGHDHYISSLTFSPDGNYVYTASRDKTIMKWNVETGKSELVFGGNSWLPTKVSFSPDGKYLVSTGNDYDIKVWNLHSITEVKDFKSHKGSIFGFNFSPDSVNMLVYGEDRIPRLWNFSNGNKVMNFISHDQVVLGAGFSPDGKYCFSYSNDKKVILWEVADGRKILVSRQLYLENSANFLAGNQNPSALFAFTPDSKYLITADSVINEIPVLHFYDVTNGKLFKSLTITTDPKRTGRVTIRHISISPDGRSLICGMNYETDEKETAEIQFINLSTFNFAFRLLYEGDLYLLAVTSDNLHLVCNEEGGNIRIYDLKTNKLLNEIEDYALDEQNRFFSPDNKYLLAFKGKSFALFNLENGHPSGEIEMNSAAINSAAFSPDGQFIVTCAMNNVIRIIDLKTKTILLTLVQFGESDWVVTNGDGLFDASANAMKLLYYVSGMKVIELEQMKERYYEPNLLPKSLGFNKEAIRDVESLSDVRLFPDVKADFSSTNLVIDLLNQGGGIGRVVILVNGKEVASDARGPKPNPNAEKLQISYNLKDHPYLQAGKENVVEVKAYNAEGYLVSRGAAVKYNPPETSAALPPKLFVISCGVSDYTGDQIDLKYAAKDAEDIGKAIQIGGERLFGADKTFLYMMTTNTKDEKMQPTRVNILRQFDEIAQKTTSSDVFILYLSGHGINWGGQDGDFYYLTKDAFSSSADAYNDPKIRASSSISSAELTDLFKKIPALKQVMIIDACASGKAVENLMAKRDISANTLRALDRMKDRVGMYIITGCAADAVSYEASKFGQGLLTYSLLEGIKGKALRDDRFVDVAQLFTAAQERVPELAADIGGIQKPQVFSPYGSQSFDIGELDVTAKTNINLAMPKPMYLLSVFQEEESMDDILGIEKLVDDALRSYSSKGNSPLIFIQAKEFPEAFRIRGQYTVVDKKIDLKVNVFKGKTKIGNFNLTGNEDDLGKLVDELVTKTLEIGK